MRRKIDDDDFENIIYGIIIILVLVLFYCLYSYTSEQYMSVKEGFRLNGKKDKDKNDDSSKEEMTKLSPSEVSEKIEKNRLKDKELDEKKDKISKLLDEAYDELNKNKHREDYEELIHDLEDLVDTNILNHIMENKDNLLSEDLSNPASMQEIERINELDKFKQVLKNMNTFIRK